MAKLTGATARAVSSYNDFGPSPASAIDGSSSTAWSSSNTYTSTVNEVFALVFSTPVNVKRIKTLFFSWGRNLSVGYADAFSTSRADYTLLRDIDIPAGATDDDGKLWKRWNVTDGASLDYDGNTIRMPENNVSAKVWAIFTKDSSSGPLATVTPNVDRLRIIEIEMYSDADGTPNLLNPKAPTSAPVLPFSATPANWTRTEFATPGTFDFTPAADTQLLMVVAQGAGAGGRVNSTLSLGTTPTDTGGGDSSVKTANGLVILGSGGKTQAYPELVSVERTTDNWLKFIDGNYSRVGAYNYVNAAPAGGQSYLNGTPGAAFTLAGVQTNIPADTASNSFTGAAPSTKLTWTFTGKGVRQNTTGLSLSALDDSVTLPFKAVEGQTLTLTFAATSGVKYLSIYLNGEVVDTYTLDSASRTRTVAITKTGDQVLTVAITSTSSGTLGLSNLAFSPFGIIPSRTGASGRLAAIQLLPIPLKIEVGAGGAGYAGGQSVTSAQNGTRGSGGGVGGKGGDGVVIVYELKARPNYEVGPNLSFNTYNLSPASELSGAYRTNYMGVQSTALYGTQTEFKHKLRERTKTVFVLMVGAGGRAKSRSDGDGSPYEQSVPTVFNSGAISVVADSGWSGNWLGNGTGFGGTGGEMRPSPNLIFSGKGTNGYSSDVSRNSSPEINGNYGLGGGSSYLSASGGGNGGYGLVALAGKDLPESRELTGLVANSHGTAWPGAVYIYETETEYGPYTTQTVEQILKKEFLAETVVSQVPELILKKESDAANPLQISHAAAVFIIDQADPETATTQTPELILKREPPGASQITQTPELILTKSGKTPYNITQVPQLLLVSEIPSVFWLNFGTLVNPNRFELYTSLDGRATSVQQGAYIQLESPHAAGTTLVINGVEVGLSAPVANNDRVAIKGGITNFWQKEMNVYTYYTKNGQIARELVGTWKIQQPDLMPVKGRAYSTPAQVSGWIWSRNYFGKVQMESVARQSLSAIGKLVGAVYTSGRSALASLGQIVTRAYAAVFRGPDAVANQNNQSTMRMHGTVVGQNLMQLAKGLDSEVSKVHTETTDELVSGWINPKAEYGATEIAFEESLPVGYSSFETGTERASVGQVEYENTAFIPTVVNDGHGQHKFEVSNKLGFDEVGMEYEYLYVGKSVSHYQEFQAMVSTGFAQTFQMGFFPTTAYSVLVENDYLRGASQGSGSWIVPLAYADLAKVNYGTVERPVPVKDSNHSELVGRETYKEGAHDFATFTKSSMFAQVGISQFEILAKKRVEHTELVGISWVRAIARMGIANLTPYRPAQSVNGRGAASLYMGFDTVQAVEDYTSKYSGVTNLQMYNGYVYNLAVDKTFICEIYFNGPISGLIHGG